MGCFKFEVVPPGGVHWAEVGPLAALHIPQGLAHAGPYHYFYHVSLHGFYDDDFYDDAGVNLRLRDGRTSTE